MPSIPGARVQKVRYFPWPRSAFLALLAYVWGSAAWEKFPGTEFVSHMSATLTAFAAKNPHAWYQAFLVQTAATHAERFGWMVVVAESVVGIVCAIAAVTTFVKMRTQSVRWIGMATVCALTIGAFLNLNFYFAAGWMSVSTAGLNSTMFWMQVILIGAVIGTLKDGTRGDGFLNVDSESNGRYEAIQTTQK